MLFGELPDRDYFDRRPLTFAVSAAYSSSAGASGPRNLLHRRGLPPRTAMTRSRGPGDRLIALGVLAALFEIALLPRLYLAEDDRVRWPLPRWGLGLSAANQACWLRTVVTAVAFSCGTTGT
jgi:hypothetical protein